MNNLVFMAPNPFLSDLAECPYGRPDEYEHREVNKRSGYYGRTRVVERQGLSRHSEDQQSEDELGIQPARVCARPAFLEVKAEAEGTSRSSFAEDVEDDCEEEDWQHLCRRSEEAVVHRRGEA